MQKWKPQNLSLFWAKVHKICRKRSRPFVVKMIFFLYPILFLRYSRLRRDVVENPPKIRTFGGLKFWTTICKFGSLPNTSQTLVKSLSVTSDNDVGEKKHLGKI